MNTKLLAKRLSEQGIEVTADLKIHKSDLDQALSSIRNIVIGAKDEKFNVQFGVSGSEGDSGDSWYLRNDTLPVLLKMLSKKGYKYIDEDNHWCESDGAGCTLTFTGEKKNFIKTVKSLKASDIDEDCVEIDVDIEDDEIVLYCNFDFDKPKIIKIIKVGRKNYTIDQLKDLKEVKGDLDLNDIGLTELPDLSHLVVHGNFSCAVNNLTSLKGAPLKVGGDFDCSDNNLTSLEGAPLKVGGDFDCSDNNLTSLEGAPKEVGGGFDCSENPKKFSKSDIKKAMKG